MGHVVQNSQWMEGCVVNAQAFASHILHYIKLPFVFKMLLHITSSTTFKPSIHPEFVVSTYDMALFHPSQIRWSSFVNRDPTKVADLWPPLNFNDRNTTTTTTTESPSVADKEARYREEDSPSSLVSSNTSSNQYHCRRGYVESLKAFVEREIGLQSIRTGRSGEEANESSSSKASNNSKPIEHAHCANKGQCCHIFPQNDENDVPDESTDLEVDAIKESEGRSNIQRSREVKLSTSFVLRRLVQRNLTLEQHLQDKAELRWKVRHTLHDAGHFSKRLLRRS